MYRIAVIGVGGIGSRHLQALAHLKLEAEIYGVDLSQESLKKAKALYQQTNEGFQPPLVLLEDISALPHQIDVAVIATSSRPRRKILEDLLATKDVKLLVLEKVLFPYVEDYEAVRVLLEQHHCKAWVNHPRRMNAFYQDLARQFAEEETVEVNISGGNWGLGCNTLHFIDLISQITGNCKGLTIDNSGLDDTLLESKRSGYLEFTGTLTGSMEKCSHFSITSYAGDMLPTRISILGRHIACFISESKGHAMIAKEEEGWDPRLVEFKGQYQSELTHLLVEDILSTGNCSLPTYEMAMEEHVPFLETMLEFLNNRRKEESDLCPIT